MKVSYNTTTKFIITWWDEESGIGIPDQIYPMDNGEKVIIDLPEINEPGFLEFPLDCYVFDDDNNMVVDAGRSMVHNPANSITENLSDFNKAKVELINRIDAVAEKTRESHITNLPGQIMAYAAKEAEAINFVNAGYPDNTQDYIMLYKESTERKIPINELADTIIEKATEWKLVSANIEAVRLKYKDLALSLTSESATRDDMLVIGEEATKLLYAI